MSWYSPGLACCLYVKELKASDLPPEIQRSLSLNMNIWDSTQHSKLKSTSSNLNLQCILHCLRPWISSCLLILPSQNIKSHTLLLWVPLSPDLNTHQALVLSPLWSKAFFFSLALLDYRLDQALITWQLCCESAVCLFSLPRFLLMSPSSHFSESILLQD